MAVNDNGDALPKEGNVLSKDMRIAYRQLHRLRFAGSYMPKAVDYWTWTEMGFQEWRNFVDQRLMDVYLISLDDAGIDDGYLTPHWEAKESPWNFVEWYALKYDLDPKSAVWL